MPKRKSNTSIKGQDKRAKILNRKTGDIRQSRTGSWTRWDGKKWKKVCEDCHHKRPSYGVWNDDETAHLKWCASCAAQHKEAISFTKKCHDCHQRHSSYGTIREDGTINKQWCAKCRKNHPEAVKGGKTCEDCHIVYASYGLLNDDGSSTIKWCLSCAEKHEDYVDCHKKCEDCNGPQPSCGTLNDKGVPHRRWCGKCAKNHDESINFQKKCEICELKRPHYGQRNEDGTAQRKWCLDCAKKQDNYVDLHKMCEDCHVTRPMYGIIDENGRSAFRWCVECAKKHDDYKSFQRPCLNGCGKQSHKDGFCTTCHPDYIPTFSGASRIACEFIDELGSQLGVRDIQHKHYDPLTQTMTGDEKCIQQYRADGYFMPHIEQKLPFDTSKHVVVEFYGNAYHGFPNNEKKEEVNYFGKSYGEMYEATIKREQAILGLGYRIIRIFENEYKDWKKHRVGTSLLSACTILG